MNLKLYAAFQSHCLIDRSHAGVILDFTKRTFISCNLTTKIVSS